MKIKQISAEELALETSKFLGQAQRTPLVIRSKKGPALLLRPVADDDPVDQLVVSNSRFRASVRRGRRDRAAGKAIPWTKLRESL